MSTIAIDCRFSGKQTGLGRYTREIVSHMLELDRDNTYILFVKSEDEPWLKDLKGNFHLVTAFFPYYSLKEQTLFPFLLRKAKADLLFTPHFNLPFFCPLKAVITIHDLILHHYPNQSSLFKRIAYKVIISRAVRKAKKIIAISKFTRGDLYDTYSRRRLKKKTVVIYEGASAIFKPQSKEVQDAVHKKYGIEKPFFIYIGNSKEHKNVQMLIDAFRKSSLKDTELLLVTGGPESNKLYLCDNVRILDTVPESDMPALYSSALSFVTASLYEGFCLPIVEARACGCPIIATNCAAFPEVAPKNALLVEPTCEALSMAMCSPPKKTDPHSIPFSWEKAARETLAVIDSVL